MGGSLRAETAPDERAVWLDFLCLANTGDGRFDAASRDALAAQLLITRELLDRSIKKFIEAHRLAVHYDKQERKEVFIILKWAFYQAPPKPHRKTGDPEGEPPPHTPPLQKDINKDREIERERGGGISAAGFSEKGEILASKFPPLPEIPETFSFELKDKLREQKAFIRELERLSLDSKARQMHGVYTEEELKYAIEKERKCYRQAIEDRR
jgi:hypothetical protein